MLKLCLFQSTGKKPSKRKVRLPDVSTSLLDNEGPENSTPTRKQTPKSASKSSTPSKKSRHSKSGKSTEETTESAKGQKEIIVSSTNSEVSQVVTPLRTSGRSRRNVSTPNWADIISGKKSFKADGAVLLRTVKVEPDGDPEEIEEVYGVEEEKQEKERKEAINKKKIFKSKEVKLDGTSDVETEKKRNSVALIGKKTDLKDSTEKAAEKVEDIDSVENDKEKDSESKHYPESASKESEQKTDKKIVVKFSCVHCNMKYTSEFLLEQHVRIVHGKAEKGENTEEMLDVDYSDQDDFIDGDDDDDYADDDYDGSNDYSKEMISKKGFGDYRYVKKRKGIGKRSGGEKNPVVVGKKPVCDICGTMFLSMANLRKHRLLHTDKMYECPYCAKIMKRKDYVIAHVKKCHKDVDLDTNPIDFDKYTHTVTKEELEEIEQNADDELEAAETEEIGDGKEKAKTPRIKVITGLGKKVCPECSKLFDTQEDLEQHMILVHNKELKDAAYTCQACKKEFKTLVSYQVHKLSHRKKDFVCPHCDKKFVTNSQLQVHKRRDHQIQYGTLMYFGFLMNNGRIMCEICSSDFDSMEDYLDHRTEHLTFEYLCSVCGNGFETEKDLEIHKDSSCAKQNLHLACGKCDAKFAMYDTRRRHVQVNHPKESETDNYCHHCGMTFDDIEQLRVHFSEHQKEKIFICELCEKRFYEKRNLVDHRELHRSSKNFQCNICLKFYISSKSLQRHIKLHLAQNKMACKHCDEKFNNKDDFNRHMKQEHSVEPDLPAVDDGNKFLCPKCNRTFPSNTKLVRHMQLHPDDPSSSYMCVHCDNVYDSNDMPLWEHMKTAHPNVNMSSGQKSLTCEICGFSTVIKQRMERHMETHNPDKMFQCKYCGKKYQTTSSLMTHMISHRGKVKKGAKPQPICTWPGCRKQFMKHSIYKRHLISHIFKIKVGKDFCDCGKCQYSSGQEKRFLFNGGASSLRAVGFVDQEGNSHVASQLKHRIAPDGSSSLIEVNMSSNSNSQESSENYQSMEVLHEAIAQIEDIEKSNENSNDTGDNRSTGIVAGASETSTSKLRELQEETIGSEIRTEDAALNPDSVLNKDGVVNEFIEAADVDTNTGTNADGSVASAATGEAGFGALVSVKMSGSTHTGLTGNQQALTGQDISVNTEVNNGKNAEQETSGKTQTNLSEAGTQIVDMPEDKVDSSLSMLQKAASLDESAEALGIALSGYECGVCELMFMHKCQVLLHLEDAHEEHAFPRCDVCGKYMVDRKNLNDHKLIHDEERRFACDVCGRKFRTRQCLRQHSYVHAEVKPFQCEHCGHGFTQRGFYEEHLRRHLGLRPFQCAVCSKSFVSKSMLKVHMYSHTGNRPYQCQYCPKTFSENYHLQNHIRNHIDDRPFQCTECQKAFCVKPKLIRHMNTVHGIEKEALSSYYPTKVGKGIGYRDRNKTETRIEPRKTQVVYIDAQGNIVRQEMKTDQELQMPQITTTKAAAVKSVIEQTKSVTMEEVQLEVVTQRDAEGNIQTIVPPQFLPESLISMPEETTEDNVVYQEIHTDGASGENVELAAHNYTLVTTGTDFTFILTSLLFSLQI